MLANVIVDFDSRNQPVHKPRSGERLKPYSGEGAGSKFNKKVAAVVV